MYSALKITKLFIDDNDVFSQKSKNNWSLIRLLAAVLVVYGHSFALNNPNKSQDTFIIDLTNGEFYSGSLAVVIFFIISGGMISSSLLQTKYPWAYFLRRILRIYPALLFSLSTTSLYLFFTIKGIEIDELFTWYLSNATAFENTWNISNVWQGRNYSAINGSLWSIPIEVRLYIIYGFVLIFHRRINRKIIIAFSLVLISYLTWQPNVVPLIGSELKLAGNPAFREYAAWFIVGSLIAMLKLGKLSVPFLLFTFVILASIYAISGNIFLLRLLVISGLLLISKIQVPFSPNADYSYSLYLIAWPMAQIIFSLGPHLAPHQAFILTVIIATPYCFVSWRFIESPTIRFSHRFGLNRNTPKNK